MMAQTRWLLLLLLITTMGSGCQNHPQPEVPITVGPGDWPMWRGPQQNGIAVEQSIPLTWSENQNVVWKAEVPGRGHSSPVRYGSKVFLTTANEDQKTQSVLGFDFQTGELLWNTVVHRGHFPQMHSKNSQASATVCCDGQHVFAAFINGEKLWVTSLDLEGHQVWQKAVGPFHSEHGYGASPTMFGSLLILSGDSLGEGYLAALNRGTGDLVWKTPRDPAPSNGNYATPIIAQMAGHPHLLLAGFNHVSGYAPETGKSLWQLNGPAQCIGNTVAARDPFIVATGGYPEQKILGIKIDDLQQVSAESIVWKGTKNVAYVPSPLIVDDQVLILADDGPLANYNLETGKLNWQKRLPGNFTASLTQVGSVFLVPNETGETVVFEISPEFKILSKNKLDDEGGMATPAFCEGHILIRTDHALYCIGNSAVVSK